VRLGEPRDVPRPT